MVPPKRRAPREAAPRSLIVSSVRAPLLPTQLTADMFAPGALLFVSSLYSQDIYVHRCDVGTAVPKQYAGSSAKALLTQLLPPSALRVLPTMAMRLLRLKLLKFLKLPVDRAHQEGSIEIWIVMDDDGLTKLDLEDESRDLAWWGMQDGSHIVVFTMKAHQN